MAKRHHITRMALTALLACSLAGASLAAFADEGAAESGSLADATTSAETAQESESGGASSQTAPAELHGLYAAASQVQHANETSVAVTAESACGLFAEAGATIIANALDVAAQGTHGCAVATSDEGGAISLANAQLSTGGTQAPLVSSAGAVEIDNTTGTAAQSPIAHVLDLGRLLVANSTLASTFGGNTSGELPACAIALYRENALDATASQAATALFQASDSTLTSDIESGSFFYLTNTAASIVLSHTGLDFDDDNAKLLVAAGSDATSGLVTSTNAQATFGTAGKNGATATFTALDEQLEGDIEVDSISSLDFYLLDGSKWTGAASITANPGGTDAASNIVVNVDATSGWIVTENSTVSTLNIEKGGSLVDEAGKAVTIVDADGNKLVDGASDVQVAVTDEFTTTVKTSSANQLQASTIDRTAFDEEFGTSTAFGTNGADGADDEARAAELQALIAEWFHNL